MQAREEDAKITLSYGEPDVEIELHEANAQKSYQHKDTDRYWKIGISVPDLDLAWSALRSAGIEVSDPHQFHDIGYMAHLDDPEGFKIELLQQTFQGRPKKLGYLVSNHVFSGIGQVTLRTHDVDQALAFYRDRLGMRLLSIQPVPQHGFTLYFLAFTDDTPPREDLRAVENREWLWQRPYTSLELQVFDAPRSSYALPSEDTAGFAGLVIDDPNRSGEILTDDGGGPVSIGSDPIETPIYGAPSMRNCLNQ